MKGLEGVEDVLVIQGTGDVHVKCADGTELTEEQVAQAVETGTEFEVTTFAMHTPEAAPDEDGPEDTPGEDGR